MAERIKMFALIERLRGMNRVNKYQEEKSELYKISKTKNLLFKK